jgi:hypothetical protein
MIFFVIVMILDVIKVFLVNLRMIIAISLVISFSKEDFNHIYIITITKIIIIIINRGGEFTIASLARPVN